MCKGVRNVRWIQTVVRQVSFTLLIERSLVWLKRRACVRARMRARVRAQADPANTDERFRILDWIEGRTQMEREDLRGPQRFEIASEHE